MALTPTDRLLAGYVAAVSLLLAARGPLADDHPWVLGMHLLFFGLLWLFTRVERPGPAIRTLHVFYPILFLLPFYGAIGLINEPVGLDRILAHDTVVQGWEAALFGEQVAYTWIREAPSVFWSAFLHFAYFFYYPIVIGGPLLVTLRHGLEVGRSVVFAMMLAFVVCYLVFVLFPVAGPNYAFPHPTGPVREVWSARLVYGVLAGGSSVGAAFPSSHVAATVAAAWSVGRAWRGLGHALIVPTVLLTVATVYCQMHYAVDAASGLLIGVGAGAAAQWLWERWSADDAPAPSPVISTSVP